MLPLHSKDKKKNAERIFCEMHISFYGCLQAVSEKSSGSFFSFRDELRFFLLLLFTYSQL